MNDTPAVPSSHCQEGVIKAIFKAIDEGATLEVIEQVLNDAGPYDYKETLHVNDTLGDLPPLHFAIDKDSPAYIVNALIRTWPDCVKQRDTIGCTPLHRAVLKWVFLPVTSNREAVLSSLIEAWPASVTECGGGIPAPPLLMGYFWKYGKEYPGVTSPDELFILHTALCIDFPVAAIQTLLHSFPEAVRVLDCRGCLPIHVACRKDASVEVLRILCEKWPGALAELNEAGFSPLRMCYDPDCVPGVDRIELLVRHRPELCQMRSPDNTIPLQDAVHIGFPLTVIQAMYNAWPEAIKERSPDGREETVLHLALRHKADERVICFLVEKWPESATVTTSLHQSALHYACKGGYKLMAVKSIMTAFPKALRLTDVFTQTPLEYATSVYTDRTSDVLMYLKEAWTELEVAGPAPMSEEDALDVLRWRRRFKESGAEDMLGEIIAEDSQNQINSVMESVMKQAMKMASTNTMMELPFSEKGTDTLHSVSPQDLFSSPEAAGMSFLEQAAIDPERVSSVASGMDPSWVRKSIRDLMESTPAYIEMQRSASTRVKRNNLNESLPKHAVFLSFRRLLSLDTILNRQALQASDIEGNSFLSPGEDDIWLAIFVSHRWASKDHPDMDAYDDRRSGLQLEALKRFVHMFLEIMKATRGFRDSSAVPDSLLCHGWLQAAYVAGLDSLRSKAEYVSSPDKLESLLLDRCGIWYDFCCLYQKPRNEEQTLDFKATLSSLSEVVRECSCTVALRSGGDDYFARGWCTFEMAAGIKAGFESNMQQQFEFPLLLKMEKLGEDIPETVFSHEHMDLPTFTKMEFVKSFVPLEWALEQWILLSAGGEDTRYSMKDIIEIITDVFMGPFILLSTENGVVVNGLSEGEQATKAMISDLKVSLNRLISGSVSTINLQPLLRNSITSNGLSCTNGSDYSYLAGKLLQHMNPPSMLEGLPKDFLKELIRRSVITIGEDSIENSGLFEIKLSHIISMKNESTDTDPWEQEFVFVEDPEVCTYQLYPRPRSQRERNIASVVSGAMPSPEECIVS